MYHTIGFTASVNGVTNGLLTALQDDIIPRSTTSGAYILPEDMMLFGAYAQGPNLLRARFASASLRQVNQPFIRPVNAVSQPPANVIMQTFLDQPWRIKANEEFNIEVTDSGGGATQVSVVLFLGPTLDQIPAGDIITARATSTSTAGVRAWTTLNYTMDQTLPPGRFALVGSECISTTGIAHRWIVPNQYYRPGMLSTTTNLLAPNWVTNTRQFGVMGSFLNTVLPQVQVFCNAADAAFELYLQLIKLT
jgi:hypothetical protein